MSLVGYSHSTLVEYVISLSKKATSPADFLDFLDKHGLKGCCGVGELHAFAQELFAKLQDGRTGQDIEEGAMQKRRIFDGSSFEDIDNDGHEDDFKLNKKRCLDEDLVVVEERRRIRRRTELSEDENSEEERLCDQRERKELEQQTREQDGAKQILTRNNVEEDAMKTKVPGLRKISRQKYMKKRLIKKLEGVRDEIEDEEYLFENVKLTEAETCKLRYKKQIYDLVKKHTDYDMNEYRMPDAYDQEGAVNQEKRFSLAVERYRYPRAAETMKPYTEQEAWEDQQIGKATMKFGSKERKQKGDDYDFVFENQIEWIKHEVMNGRSCDGEAYGDSL